MHKTVHRSINYNRLVRTAKIPSFANFAREVVRENLPSAAHRRRDMTQKIGFGNLRFLYDLLHTKLLVVLISVPRVFVCIHCGEKRGESSLAQKQ